MNATSRKRNDKLNDANRNINFEEMTASDTKDRFLPRNV